MKHRETLSTDSTVSTPLWVSAEDIRREYSVAVWSIEIDLMFDISCEKLIILDAAELARGDDKITWNTVVELRLSLVPDEPLPKGHYNSDVTRDYITADPTLPDGWEIEKAWKR